MKSFHAIICANHKEIVVADDTCETQHPLEFLLKHRLCECQLIPWCSSLDLEDNGFSFYSYFKGP